MKPIWIVDDDQSIRFVLERALQREGLVTRSFTEANQVLAALADAEASELPSVLVSDIRMPGVNGLELLAKVKTRQADLPIIIMTAYSDLDSAVSAFQGGAFEYLAKPFDVSNAVELVRRALEESTAAPDMGAAPAVTPEMLGQAPAMQELFRAIGRLSQSHVTVLITGESGTGKELVAKALHKHSPRAAGPFVAINTAAIPKDLLESELFGHERGAFTGAQTMRRGRFEQADGGTLFLDEIGDMPFDLQTRLLRVLSEGSFYRVGGHSAIKVQVRVIAATHQDLERRVAQGHFREDLFHRLNVIRLRIPALRERLDDVPVLIRHFLIVSAKQLGVEAKRLSPPAMRVLSAFHFPGNVRQLENLCHWLSVMAPGQVVDVKDLPPEVSGQERIASAAFRVPLSPMASVASDDNMDPSTHLDATLMRPSSDDDLLGQTTVGAPWMSLVQGEAATLLAAGHTDVWDQLTHKFEAALITAAVAHTRGRRVEAANKLGIGRNTITRKIHDLGLDESLRELR